MDALHKETDELKSPSSQRAWIEIRSSTPAAASAWQVALLAEGVDRNHPPPLGSADAGIVALLAEGVDRNHPPPLGSADAGIVALLAEGVDRNLK